MGMKKERTKRNRKRGINKREKEERREREVETGRGKICRYAYTYTIKRKKPPRRIMINSIFVWRDSTRRTRGWPEKRSTGRRVDKWKLIVP
jgi:hypothetical protein